MRYITLYIIKKEFFFKYLCHISLPYLLWAKNYSKMSREFSIRPTVPRFGSNFSLVYRIVSFRSPRANNWDPRVTRNSLSPSKKLQSITVQFFSDKTRQDTSRRTFNTTSRVEFVGLEREKRAQPSGKRFDTMRASDTIKRDALDGRKKEGEEEE